MNRLKLLATATLMALTFTACDEGTPPPVEPPPPPTPVGTISGTVTIEGTAASGITATLSSGATTTTGSGGDFAFSGVEAGTYTVTISGFPEDATFAQVTQSATIATDGQNVQLNFAGEYIRSSAVVGNVVAADAMMSGSDGQPETLAGVTVTLGGEHAMGETMETDMSGGFAFTGLRAGIYTVTISDFPEDVSFEEVSLEISVEVGEVGQADFTGHFIRTSAVEGQVIIEGEGLAGVTVTLSGGPADEAYTMMTDADGMYRFEELRPGSYTVSISDFDTRDYEFASTSQDVSVDLDETGTVSFTGVLLRTSGISGRVSVEGMGLGDVEVTLAGGDENRTAMTDAGGQYAFAGLAAGDYMVSISVESDAYVFESMSSDVALGDDESAIVNFEGAHARTASVSGRLFVDEVNKNDMHDEGEAYFPSVAMLAGLQAAGITLPPVVPVPVTLVGPGVHESMSGALNVVTGSFAFEGLRAGSYQLRIGSLASVLAALPPAAAAVLQDFEYGGPANGYAIEVGVGEAAMQNVPVDITHTTVVAAVTLKGGENRGMLIPGATVDLYSGDSKVGSGVTGDNGATSIRFARAGTSDNTVQMAVSVEGYFMDPGAGMQDVTWDPTSPMHPAMGADAPAVLNDADILNLAVDVSVSGATVTTDYGGGEALGGWAINVMSGEDAVEGAPEMLDDDGNAAYQAMVTPADLPATFSFSVADDQDDDLDGGENYEGGTVMHMHSGLTLAGTVDAGTMEVQFTTQTLKVYVHHERDQVMGFTGSVLGGDVRASGMVDVSVRYIADNGRSRAFTSADKIKSSDKDGVYTFSNVPADANLIAIADEAADDIKLLYPDELAAYTDMEGNGITGGAFGDQGGFSHTVSLCPLQAVEPAGQDHDKCASFAFVSTYSVGGLVWKRGVSKSGDDFAEKDPVFVDGITVGLDPVEGKNLAGEAESYTSADEDDEDTDLDETHQFAFDDVAAGVYEVSVPSGWRARMGGKGSEAAVGNAFNPLAGDVDLDVTPSTATLYGRVSGSDGFALDSVSVTVNGQSVETDASGRYIVDGIAAQSRKIGSTTHRNKIFLEASRAGFDNSDLMILDFAANSVERHDFAMGGTAKTASVSGTVTAFGSTTPVSGVEIRVDGVAPVNKNAKSKSSEPKNDIYLTGSDGSYTIRVPAKATGATSRISAHKDGYTFTPAHLDLSTPEGSAISGINFQAVANSSISGRVQNPDGGPMSGVEVTATDANGNGDDATTGVTGTYSLSVPAGTYTMAFSKDGYSFTCPGDPASCSVTVGLGQSVSFGDAKSTRVASSDATLSALSLSDGTLDPAFASDVTAYTAEVGNSVDTVTVSATANSMYADTVVIMPVDANEDMAGHQVALTVGETAITVTVTAEDGTVGDPYTVTVDRGDGHEAPSAPTSLDVTPGDQSATVTWRAPRQIGSTAITGYDWEASAPGQLTRSGTNTTAAVDGVFTQAVADLVNGATYTFSVWAVNTNGTVNVRGPAATATAKAQPSITMAIDNTTLNELPAGATDTATVTITLSNPSTETITVTVVERFAEDDEDMTSQVDITNPTIVIAAGSTTAASGADPTTITAKNDVVDDDDANALVQATAANAIDSDADTGTEGLQPATITITDDDTVSDAPRNLTVTAGDTQLTLEWVSPASSGSSDVMHYQVRHSTETLDEDDEWSTVSGGAGARTHVITGLTNDTAVNVEVRAVTAAGNGTAATGSGTPTG